MTGEGSLQKQCTDLLDGLGIYYVNTHGNAFERRGRPDLYICCNGRFIGCELKRGGDNAPTPLQQKHLREIRTNGGIGEWITSLEELKNILQSLSGSPAR